MTCPHAYESHDRPGGELLKCRLCGAWWDGEGWPEAKPSLSSSAFLGIPKSLLYIGRINP